MEHFRARNLRICILQNVKVEELVVLVENMFLFLHYLDCKIYQNNNKHLPNFVILKTSSKLQ